MDSADIIKKIEDLERCIEENAETINKLYANINIQFKMITERQNVIKKYIEGVEKCADYNIDSVNSKILTIARGIDQLRKKENNKPVQ